MLASSRRPLQAYIGETLYNTPTLFEALYKEKVLACGTVISTRRGMPPGLQTTNLRKGEHIVRRKGKLTAVKRKDKRDIYML